MNLLIKGLALFSALSSPLMVNGSSVETLHQHQRQLSEQGSLINVVELTNTTTSWDGSLLPSYQSGQPEVRIMKYHIAKGATLPLHQHPFINAGVLLKGRLQVEKEDGTTLLLNAGDTIVELVNQWHLGKSIGEEDAEIIVFYAGIQGQPIVIKQPEK